MFTYCRDVFNLPLRAKIGTKAALYWQSEIAKQKAGPSGKWNFAFATLGALILDAAQQPVWSNLLGAGAVNNCLPPSAGSVPCGKNACPSSFSLEKLRYAVN